jgi:hypothetical protein
VRSMSSKQPVSLVSTGHSSENLSTSESNVGKKKSRVKFPCRLCEGSHQNHIFPRMDEASK